MLKSRFIFPVAGVVAAVAMYLSQSTVQASELAHSTHHSLLPMQAAAAAPPSQDPASQLPAGKGRDVTIRVCTQCHGVNNFADKRYTKDRWDSVIDDMTGKGMDASDEDVDAVEKYLSTYLTPDAQGNGSSGSSSAAKKN